MCGRYALTNTLDDEYVRIMRDALKAPPPEIKPNFNISPRQMAPVLRIVEGKHVWEELRWGFRPAWQKDKNRAPHNARAEGVFESGMFKPSALGRRCLVPASGWYEWHGPKGSAQPYFIKHKEGSTLTFAGIWTTWYDEDDKPEHSFAIVTTEANPMMERIHDRMPVILDEKDFEAWLDPEFQDVPLLKNLLQPYRHKDLVAYPVGIYVNRPQNNGEQCIERIQIPK